MTTYYVEGGDLSIVSFETDPQHDNRTVAAVAGAASAVAAIIIGPVANADPNSNAADHATNEHAQRGLTVAGVAGDGPAAVIGAIPSNRPAPGLQTALSHVPTPKHHHGRGYPLSLGDHAGAIAWRAARGA